MTRPIRTLPLLFLPFLLVACGTEKADAGAGTGTTSGTGAAADPAELASRAEALGVAPEMVYVTEAPGFTVAEQSVGVFGDDGFHAAYFNPKTHAQLEMFVDRDTRTAKGCPTAGSAQDGPARKATCERDGDLWYRDGADRHEYLVPRDGHVVRLVGDADRLDRAALRDAAEAVHRPDAAELAALLPPAPVTPATEPVERGDLPPAGDGAPDNGVGASG
ncbi:hypothetical protein [Streptomyces sp. MMBL 11-3]|uniref:hypothetical protein n=1 Tax=Streptomyces sp. MMBL 11-3 TaxID=3382639 RepID=UPI0039B5DA73